jgi:ferric-dicitrate binding protein FerR (iron transport regulator)
MKSDETYNQGEAFHPDEELLRRYVQGELGPEESGKLEKRLDSEPVLREEFRQMKRIWDLSASMGDFRSIDAESDWNKLKKMISGVQDNLPDDIAAPEDEPSLDGEPALPAGSVPGHEQVGDARFSEHPENEFTIVPRLSPVARFIRIAAVFVLVAITAAMIYYYTGEGEYSNLKWVSLETGESIEELILPDGSVVTLNSGTKLSYPEEFKRKKRSVKLEGEAFFEVSPDPGKPFIITAGDQAGVEVLGTSFNLRTDPKNRKVFLNVVSGKVAFFPKGKRNSATLLEKDQHAVYEKGGISQPVSLDLNFLSWKTSVLEFDDTPLREVVEQLGRHYRKEIRIADPVLDALSLTGTYNKQSLEDIIYEIELVLEVTVTETGGVLELHPAGEVPVEE